MREESRCESAARLTVACSSGRRRNLTRSLFAREQDIACNQTGAGARKGAL
jgi:hypothetical protein